MKHLQTAQKVVKWLGVTSDGQPWAAWAQTELPTHFAAIRSELHRQQRRRGAVLQTQALAQPEPEHASASELLGWGEQLKHLALAAAASTPGSGPMPEETALLLRDAAMITTVMGHTALMHRGSVLVTLKASSYAATPCSLGEQCPAAGQCCGNRLELAPPGSRPSEFRSSYTSLPQPAHYQLVVPHHKNSNKAVVGVALPISCPLACQLLEAYESRARPVLAFVEDDEEGAPVESLFVDDNGQPFTSESLCSWWARVHR
jgi:hypothetical protein